MKNSEGSMPMFFSEDQIKNILVRLPVRSMLRLKCVCKLWFSLISNPEFAQYHFDMPVASAHRFLVHSNSNGADKCNSLEIDAPLHDNSAKLALDIPLPSPTLEEGVYIPRFVSSCRGLVLLSMIPSVGTKYLTEYVVWNPSTNFQKRIRGGMSGLVGFGYDSLSDDYLVVNLKLGCTVEWMSCRSRTNLRCGKPVVGGYDSGFDKIGVFLNEALHWLVTTSDRDHWRVIVFDLREKKLSEILLPHELEVTLKKATTVARLKLMEGCLCLSLTEEQGLRISMWMMKQYKVQSSWIKSLVITCSFGPLLSKFNPICFTRDGQLLGSNANTLVKLTHRGEFLEPYWPEHTVDEFGVEFCVYRESLFAITPLKSEITIPNVMLDYYIVLS